MVQSWFDFGCCPTTETSYKFDFNLIGCHRDCRGTTIFFMPLYSYFSYNLNCQILLHRLAFINDYLVNYTLFILGWNPKCQWNHHFIPLIFIFANIYYIQHLSNFLKFETCFGQFKLCLTQKHCLLLKIFLFSDLFLRMIPLLPMLGYP